MADTSGPWDGSPWSEAQWARFASQWAPDGVLSSTDFAMTTSGLTVTLGAGRAWVRGFGFERTGTGPATTVTANANANPRRDRIVLRRSLSSHTVTPVVIAGTPASSPVAPTISAVDTGDWDLPLYSFIVPASSGTTISSIVDERVTVAGNTSKLVTGAGFFGSKLTSIGTPTASTDAATKGYVDSAMTVLSDGGWQDLGTPGSVTVGTRGAKYRVKNGVCYFNIGVFRDGWSSGFTAATFPSGARPASSISPYGFVASFENVPGEFTTVSVDSNGNLLVNRGWAGANIALVVSGSFPVG